MYLRTTRRKNKNGTVTEYYQLAHNERHPKTKNPHARIIHSFGRADELDREELVRLCRSIARVCGLTVIDPLADSQTARSSVGLPSDISIIRTVELGTPLVVEAIWERLGIGKTIRGLLKENKLRVAYDQALLAMTANRLCEPESKLGVWDRWLAKVYLPGCADLKLRHMYEAMDLLHENAAEIEKSIFYHTANLFNLEVDLIFYDTTTASFAIDWEDEEEDGEGLRRFGHSKEGAWAPQVVVALAVTREGLPVRCWVFPGNTSDVTTIDRVKADLRGWNLGRALFVADSGMNSADNRKELGRACGKYLLATRMASVAEVKNEVLSQPGRFRTIRDNLRAKEVIIGDGVREQRYIVCHNPKEEQRQRRHRDEIVRMLEEELGKHPDKRATAQWAIELLASRRYKRYLRITEAGKVRIDRAAVREAARYDGKWVLETNDDTITLEDAACGYKGLMVIERCFRSLKKTQIKMTPMFHWTPRRVEAHVRICVLALLVDRIAELACKKSWPHIQRILGTLQATEFESRTYGFFQLNEPSPTLRQVFKDLEIPLPIEVFGINTALKGTAKQ